MSRTQRCTDDQWGEITSTFANWVGNNMSIPRPGGGKKKDEAAHLALEDTERMPTMKRPARDVFADGVGKGKDKKQDMENQMLSAVKKGQNQLNVMTARLKCMKLALNATKYDGLAKTVDTMMKDMIAQCKASTELQHTEASKPALGKWLLKAAQQLKEAKKIASACKALAGA